MATGEIRQLRHQIRDIVGDGNVYNGLAGRGGLSFDAQRAELQGVAPRVGEKVTELRARADALEAKQGEVQALVDQALSIIAAREADPNFQAAVENDDEGDFPEDEEDDEFDDDDFEEYEEDDEPDEEEDPSLTEKVKEKVKEVF
jgi:hypothetical protein